MATLVKIHDDGREEVKEGGARVDAIQWKPDGTFDKVVGHEPTIGCSLKVGSVTARTYAAQDYWLTTPVVEILSKSDDEVLFRTENSTYKLMR